MKILAVDTATKSCSVAVTEDGAVLGELTSVSHQTHSRHLMEMVHQVLGNAGVGMASVDGFAVTIGPGSFTGLRIGISSIKGLAYAVDKPVVGASSLEALARQSIPASDNICALIDARKGEVYAALYNFTGGALIREQDEIVLSTDDLLKQIERPCIFLGSGAVLYRGMIEQKLGDLAAFAPQQHHHIRASTVAEIGRIRLEQGDHVGTAELVPRYIRKSDAELNFGKKLSGPKHG
jgi:tRNA threonylcarbamoyladenosine biosynthesis protein TsaB